MKNIKKDQAVHSHFDSKTLLLKIAVFSSNFAVFWRKVESQVILQKKNFSSASRIKPSFLSDSRKKVEKICVNSFLLVSSII